MSISKVSFTKIAGVPWMSILRNLSIYANKEKNMLLENAKIGDVKCFTFKLALVFAF